QASLFGADRFSDVLRIADGIQQTALVFDWKDAGNRAAIELLDSSVQARIYARQAQGRGAGS
ncbi:MAG: hypothetical protein IPK63_23745, partial [Candidatus Competibacteraceae bacterium]|nr:hypothetical protein [Candidatus Competibacteraceae bacterium]